MRTLTAAPVFLTLLMAWSTFGQTYTITTLAGNGTSGFSGDNGPATSAELSYPSGVAADSAGNLYIADENNYRIRKVSKGVITTVAGNGTRGFSGDNGLATNATLSGPAAVAVNSAGNIYIPDGARIREVSNGVITTVAGNGTGGFSGDNGPATSAELNGGGVAVDSAGNLYIADSGNNRIRKVSNGVITTVAGNGTSGFSGDNGPATSAQLSIPIAVAVDSAGDLYIADYANNRIRKVSNGVITTVAGNGNAGFSGDNGPASSAEVNAPQGVAVDSAGNLYIASNLTLDGTGDRIRRVSNGIITTVAGEGGGCSEETNDLGDGCPATSAQLNNPAGVAAGSAGNLYIADLLNQRIRMLTPVTVVTTVSAADYTAPVAPDSIVSMFAANIATGTLLAENLPLPTSLGGVSATVTDSSGNTLPIQLIVVTPLQVNAVLPGALQSGNATVNLTASNGQLISGTVSVDVTAPSLFTADQTGTWLPAAQVVTVHADGSQTFMSSVATCTDSLVWNGSTWSDCVPIPINVGSSTDQVVLELFGTGLRGANSISQACGCIAVVVDVCTAAYPAACAATSGGLNVLYIGPQGAGLPGSFDGLDQINVVLPPSLAGSGMLSLVVYVAAPGPAAYGSWEMNSSNTVTLGIQ